MNKTQSSSTNTVDNEELQQHSLKELFIIISLLGASFISIFGIYNVFGFNLIDSINNITVLSEKIANYALLLLFSITLFIMSSIYWKKKDFFSKMQIIGFLILVLGIMIGIMILWINNFIYPLISILILGISFFLFNMLFNTIGLLGVFYSVSIFSVFIVFMVKMGWSTEMGTLFSIIQGFLAFLLFLGTTYPRIRSLFFKIGTRNNVEFDGSVQTSNDDDDDDD